MKTKRICCILAVCTVLALSFSACGKSLPDAKSSLADIVASLKKDKNVIEYTVSHDSKRIAVVRMLKQTVGSIGELDIISIADNKQTKVPAIQDDDLHTIEWSYNDKYISINAGTSEQFSTYVIQTSTLKKLFEIGNSGNIWDFDKATIAFAVANKTVPPVKIDGLEEPDGSPEIVVYNADTLEHKTVLKANPQYDYTPVKWDKSGLSIREVRMTDKRTDTVTLDVPAPAGSNSR